MRWGLVPFWAKDFKVPRMPERLDEEELADRRVAQRRLIAVAQDAKRNHPGPTSMGNPGNVS
jgi:putative SOS response-associated peptidase YedK